MFVRDQQIQSIINTPHWDIVIIGGGASGLGAALDAASRGYKTLCVERFDFSKGTSSRSTKLIHGGVRYLKQGNIRLVKDALQERWFLLKNAPAMTKRIPFILPVYSWFSFLYFGIGLKIYDLLSGKLTIGSTKFLSAKTVISKIPNINAASLKGGILYYDGQFDDSEICLSLVRTSLYYGATVVNHCTAQNFKYQSGKIVGLTVFDEISQQSFDLKATVVINATGVFTDAILNKDNAQHRNIVHPSQGIHIVVPRSFYNSQYALLIPKTSDGRVLFAVPWHDKVVIGTTDVAKEKPDIEPKASDQEIDFVIQNFNQYSISQIRKKDFLSVFAGQRPLIKMYGKKSTADLLRDHTVFITASGLVTITGGKWTTYRKMARDVVNKASTYAGLSYRRCITKNIILLQRPSKDTRISESPRVHQDYTFTEADVVYAIRQEMAMTLEDILARRFRLLFLDVKSALECAPKIAHILQKELQKDEMWFQHQIKTFELLAQNYIIKS